MTNITIFEPETSSSLFSSQDALRIAAVMEALADLENYEALLFNLTDDADQFTLNKAVNEKIEAEGNSVLPITVVDGEIVKSGGYPTNDEITSYIGVRFIEDTEGSCGCGGCGCGGSEEFAEAEKVERKRRIRLLRRQWRKRRLWLRWTGPSSSSGRNNSSKRILLRRSWTPSPQS